MAMQRRDRIKEKKQDRIQRSVESKRTRVCVCVRVQENEQREREREREIERERERERDTGRERKREKGRENTTERKKEKERKERKRKRWDLNRRGVRALPTSLWQVRSPNQRPPQPSWETYCHCRLQTKALEGRKRRLQKAINRVYIHPCSNLHTTW